MKSELKKITSYFRYSTDHSLTDSFQYNGNITKLYSDTLLSNTKLNRKDDTLFLTNVAGLNNDTLGHTFKIVLNKDQIRFADKSQFSDSLNRIDTVRFSTYSIRALKDTLFLKTGFYANHFFRPDTIKIESKQSKKIFKRNNEIEKPSIRIDSSSYIKPIYFTDTFVAYKNVKEIVMSKKVVESDSLNPILRDYYAKTTKSIVTGADWYKLASTISDTLIAMQSNSKEFYEYVHDDIKGEYDETDAKKFVESKVIDYEVKSINETTSAITLYYWDFNLSFDRKKFTTLDTAYLDSAFVNNKLITGTEKGLNFGLEITPFNRIHYGPRSLNYFNISASFKKGNTYETLTDDDKATFTAEKIFVDTNSVVVNKTKDFKGFDKAENKFHNLFLMGFKSYFMIYFGKSKTVGFDLSSSLILRPKIGKFGTPDQDLAKLDFSAAFLISIPSKGKDDKDAKLFNIGFVTSLNDVTNADNGYKKDDGTKNKLLNSFGFGIRIGLPINKILL